MATGTASEGIGSKRLVVGAHYGLAGFLAQRATAVILAVYSVLLLVVLLSRGPLTYENWAALFVPLWMKLFTLLAIGALLYHAWIGIRDIWMDYIKPVWLRLSLSVATVLWLLFCAVWSVQILWRV